MLANTLLNGRDGQMVSKTGHLLHNASPESATSAVLDGDVAAQKAHASTSGRFKPWLLLGIKLGLPRRLHNAAGEASAPRRKPPSSLSAYHIQVGVDMSTKPDDMRKHLLIANVRLWVTLCGHHILVDGR
jgi:hypothetical protein